ncbi:glycosyl hydrolase [Pseudomaricurvus alkylphenolicus]|uniref:glycosyl hydrolase family 17 protein n=1 Tax=Pseudomaricurvus alkylphenolicus TaxID=1306991 RepID=UPI00141EFC49|nr:glycosyl hydrolase [Pseudomaricurvus alkylphenolicus]
MSSNNNPTLSLTGVRSLPRDQLVSRLRQILEQKIHGICFSPYVEGQEPGAPLSDGQILERLDVIQPYTRWVRTFSCSEGNEQIPALAHQQGLKTMVGVWIDDDLEQNELEIANAIDIAQAGHANILAVGNEVLLRGELSEQALIDYIQRVKSAVPGVEVGYVDAYYKFVDHPKVTDACDVILANCYPFWESCHADYSLLYMKDMYRRAQQVADGKKVIISETGWPNIGTATGAAEPSEENALRYFINTYQWAQEENIEVFYFSSFDEDWKVADEGDVGAYWGLWDKHGQLKYR